MNIVNLLKRGIALCARPMDTVAGAALLLAFFGLISRIFGLARDRILASTFGAGDILDVYYASFRIPDFLYGILVLGALSAAFIPVFSRLYAKKSSQEAWKLTSDFLVLLVGALGFLSFLVAVCMPFLVYGIAPGFNEEKREMVILFTRIMLLSPILLGASAVFGGVLIARRSFLAYSIAPIAYNIGIIFGVVVLVSFMGPIGLAWGVILGTFLHFTIQMIAAFFDGYRFVIPQTFPWQNPQIRKMFSLMGPQVLSVASNQINFWIITLFASIMAAGSLAVFNFANNLQSIPLALIGVSFAVAAFPRLSHAAGEEDMKEFIRVFMRTLKRILYFVIPAAVFLILLRAQVVRVVLGTGVFDWEDTILTSQVLGLLSLSLFAQSLLPLMARAFYSLEDTKTPFFIALVSQATNICIILLTFDRWGVYSLAFAFSLASIVQVALLFLFLKRKLGVFGDNHTRESLKKILIATFVAGMIIQGMKFFWGNVTDLNTFWEVFVQLVFAGLTGVGTYLLMSHWLKIEEFCDFRRKVYWKLFRKPKAIAVSQQQDMEGM